MNKLENAAIKYQIDFEKYKNAQANDVINLLDKACREISVYLKKTTGVYTKARYQELVKKIKSISKSLKENVDSNIAIDDIINYELKKDKKLLKVAESYIKKGDSSKIDFLYPALEQIKTAALFKPIDTKYGMTYQSYLDGIENGLYNVWDSAIRTGYLTGQTTQQIVHSVLGGVSAKSRLVTQGAINSFRNSVYSNTRTVLQSFANETRNRVYEENEKYFGSKDDYKYEYLSALDSGTCLVCGELSGKLFKSVKEFPHIPLHRGCRCLIILYFNIDNDTKASKNGYVDSNVTFEKWLDEQDEKTQQEVLGKTRYNLYKNGEKIKDFVDDGKKLTIAQIEEKLGNAETPIPKEKVKQEPKKDDMFEETEMEKELKKLKVEPIELKKLEKPLTENEIIDRISGGDETKGGSCASLAFAYATNKYGGYDMLDFRGGISRDYFASLKNLEKIAKLDGVSASFVTNSDEFKIAKELMKKVELGKEYNLMVGCHSAIIRKTKDGKIKYLELQEKYQFQNGFFELNDNRLATRFGCQINRFGNEYDSLGILIDIETLPKNMAFISLMRYINTNANKQIKGLNGSMK